MASVCVNNNVSVSQEFPSYGCFNPRSSFSCENGSGSSEIQKKHIPMDSVYGCFNPREDINGSNSSENQIPLSEKGGGDFEFSLVDPVGMLPADELFSDGKLVTKKPQQSVTTTTTTETVEIDGKCSKIATEMEISAAISDGLFSSPKAPRSSSRWREILGLKRFNKSTTNPRSSSSIKQFLNRRSSSSSSDASLPLLKDSDYHNESISLTSSRMSLSSSSSSSHDHEDLPRLSLDANLTTANPFAPSRSSQNLNPPPPRMRLVTTQSTRIGRCEERTHHQTMMMNSCRGVSVDSPRLNSSGKIVFQSLERSSSSPSSFNGGTSGYRHRGMERSYSSNVRVTPVLNVPVCSIRGGSVIFGQFFSPPSSSSAKTGSNNRVSTITRARNSTDRI